MRVICLLSFQFDKETIELLIGLVVLLVKLRLRRKR